MLTGKRPAKKAPAKKAAPAEEGPGEEGSGQEGAGQEGRGEEDHRQALITDPRITGRRIAHTDRRAQTARDLGPGPLRVAGPDQQGR